MANHKRGRPKNRRAGCLLCKPHKANGVDRRTRAELAAKLGADEQALEWAGMDWYEDLIAGI